MAEVMTTPKYRVEIGSATGVVIGPDATLIQLIQEQRLIEESLDDVRADVFVPPSQGEELVQILRSQNLIVLCGANRMGKAALARYVAYRLQEEQASWQAHRMRRGSELQDLIDVLDTSRKLIALVYNVEPLEAEDVLQTIWEMARSRDNFVVMTSDSLSENWHVPLECSACMAQVFQGFPYTEQDLERLLVSRLGEQLPALKERGLSTNTLMCELGSPSQIVRFADILSAQQKLPDAAELRELLKTIQDVQLATSRWLQGLDKHERYLALALALFDDLPERHFWSLYERMVFLWQKRDFTLVPLDYYALEDFGAFVNLGSRIVFQDADYRNAVLDAFLGQYRRSLVATLPVLQQIAASHGGSNRTTRIAVAQAVGQIGILEWAEVENVLLSWAAHTSSRVRASTSHALREMIEHSDIQLLPHTLNRLDNWVRAYTVSREDDAPEFWYIRWTVASSLGRIGRIVSQQSFRDEILPRLYGLSWDENFHVREAVLYALRSLAWTRFADVRPILNERAADWHENVRAEVAVVLGLLSTRRWLDVRDLLREWLAGNNTERYPTVLQMIKEYPPAADELYTFASQNENLSLGIQGIIVELLEAPGPDDELSLFPALVCKDNPADSFLIIHPLAHALDYNISFANELIESWQNSSHPELQVAQVVLSELEQIRINRKKHWQFLLKHCLYDEDKLQEFAATLPPDERDDFWNDVAVNREKKQRRSRMLRNILITAAVFCLAICSCLFLLITLSS